MPFFWTVKQKIFEVFFEMINKLYWHMKKEKTIQIVTLQVRIPSRRSLQDRKRVSFSASASMTVEAAVVLPLYLFAGCVMMMPFRILSVERQVQAYVEAVGEEISQTSYLSLENPEGKEVLTSVTAYGYAEAAVRMKLKELPVEKISLRSSRLLEDGETVDLVVDYEMRLPFSVFGLENVKRSSRCYRRAWTGKAVDDQDGARKTEEDEEIVYVGKSSSRYHLKRNCHYLSNQLEAVALSDIENYRNPDGRHYTACSRCGKDCKETVYILRYGEHYHSSGSCLAIQAYVTAVPKSQVEYLGPCSYCSGGS